MNTSRPILRINMLAEFNHYMDDLEILMVDAVQDWISAGCPAYWVSQENRDLYWRFEVWHGNGSPVLRYQRKKFYPSIGMEIWEGPQNWRKKGDQLHPLEAVSRVLTECKAQQEQDALEAP